MKFTHTLMIGSAVFMGALGLAATFAPDVLLQLIEAPDAPVIELVIQVIGALYLGFAALNWMGRNNAIGGIYSRPQVIANLMHFLTAGLAMLKFAATHSAPWYLLAIIACYVVFAIAFGVTLTRHPVRAP